MRVYFPAILAAMILVASCTESVDTSTKEQEKTEKTAKQEKRTDQVEDQSTAPAEIEQISDTARLKITGNDIMKYNKSKLKVKAGQVVVLTLEHIGKQPKSSMGHNWVLLKQGVDINAFGKAAVNAQDNEHIPQDRTDEIIAHTAMLGGGESDTIIFDAPEKGTYTFLCSFPGHYSMMKGEFIVE
jgi:azurin